MEVKISNPFDVLKYNINSYTKIKISDEIKDNKIMILKFLKQLKKIILSYDFDYTKIDFYDNRDFVNFIFEDYIYLPYNVNLFVSTTCDVGCKFCLNFNDIHQYLSLDFLKQYLDKYILSDNINFNIIGQGDPINYPYLWDLIKYLKNKGVHITLFTGGDNFLKLSTDKFNFLIENIDFFKFNLSSFDTDSYNLLHRRHISKERYIALIEKLKKISSSKLEIIYVIYNDNLEWLHSFLELAADIGVFSVSIKRDDWFIRKVDLNVIKQFLFTHSTKFDFNIITNFGVNFWKTRYLFYKKQTTLLDLLIENINLDMNFTKGCYQFGQSLDIIEKKELSVCCKYDIGTFYGNNVKKNFTYFKFLSCNKCPMQSDRYKNYLKYNLVKNL